MADSRIQDLPAASSVQPADLFVIASAANNYNAMQASGQVVTNYVETTAGAYATQAQASATAAQQAQQSAETSAATATSASQEASQTIGTIREYAEQAQQSAEEAEQAKTDTENALDGYLPLAGGKMTGPVHFGGHSASVPAIFDGPDQIHSVPNPEYSSSPVSIYADTDYPDAPPGYLTSLGTYFIISGDRPILFKTAGIDANQNRIENVAPPQQPYDAATKGYVDDNTYSQQQANDKFALALKTTDGPAESLTVYPDQGSNMTLVSQGFTTQAGSGDPSPTNIRAITTGGVRLQKMVLDGSLNWESGEISPNSYRFFLNLPSALKPTSNSDKAVLFCDKYPTIPTNSLLSGSQGIGYSIGLTLSIYDASVSNYTVEEWKNHLSQTPLTIWIAMADGSGDLYTPQIAQGATYQCDCRPLNAPLCEGDSVSSDGTEYHVKNQIVVDGDTDIEVASSPSGRPRVVVRIPNAKPNQFTTDELIISNFLVNASSNSGTAFIGDSASLLLESTDFTDSVEENKAWFGQNPATVVYTLETPESYTASSTPFIANPATDGSVAISGQTGGQMSATYNKSLSRAFQELQNAILSLGGNTQ